jgi:hypothetical protein
MEINDNFLSQITYYGRYEYSVRQMAIMEDMSPAEEEILQREMQDPYSQVARAYEKGRLQARQEVIKHLEETVEKQEEGAGDAAKAIGYLRRRNKEDETRKELFNL